MECVPCLIQLHEECLDGDGQNNCCCMGDTIDESGTPAVRTIQAGYKADGDIRDQTSTGRKRAAQLKPIIENMECEWSRLRYAGGGIVPIVGCNGTRLTREKGNKERTGHIHHGPDKSTLNNTDENLHRVCAKCHVRWHELNDKFYPDERPANGAPFTPAGEFAQHDKHTLATGDELMYSENWWKLDPRVKQTIPYRKVDESAE